MSAFPIVVEGSSIYNFAIHIFPCSVQNFGEKSQTKCIDQLISSPPHTLGCRQCAHALAWPLRACAHATLRGLAGPTRLQLRGLLHALPCRTPSSAEHRARHALARGALLPPPCRGRIPRRHARPPPHRAACPSRRRQGTSSTPLAIKPSSPLAGTTSPPLAFAAVASAAAAAELPPMFAPTA
jgi:hypothetical protein